MWLTRILTLVQLLSAFAIIGLVLLQRGKGADAGAGFGAGASGTVFGARGATTALSRATAIFAAIFMLNSLALAYVGSRPVAADTQRSILDEAAEKSKTVPAVPAPLPLPPPATAPTPAPAEPAAPK
ncbi:MAG TPA: preprotein translocase subunit SecG [Steroidobacteraceae bacterium]|jgi:preprotein translocase subunit SecG|nr:preprotein translocase subunit SecG [Steroidobacteraceae bacterium]